MDKKDFENSSHNSSYHNTSQSKNNKENGDIDYGNSNKNMKKSSKKIMIYFKTIMSHKKKI